MAFHDLFHDLSEFSITHVKQLFSNYCQNNLLFTVFSHITMHNIRGSVCVCVFFYWNELVFWLVCCFFNFWVFFPVHSRKVYYFATTFHDFPWPTLQFHDFPGLENEIIKFQNIPGFPWPIWTLLIMNDQTHYFPFSLYTALKHHKLQSKTGDHCRVIL